MNSGEPPVDDGTGHGLLTKFHDGCRCPWCESAARERACPCAACTAVRKRAYVEKPSEGKT